MVTPTPSERACPPPVHVNIGTDTEKPSQQDSPPFRIWRKVRLPHAINGFLVLFGEYLTLPVWFMINSILMSALILVNTLIYCPQFLHYA
nr:unnamed protein product [Callosobruchus analis]CAI5866821.1 unnamed protein product [Callosobruchus analis]